MEKSVEKREGNGNKGQRSSQIERAREPSRSPFAMMRRMFEDMDQLYGDFGWSPQIEVRERDGNLVVHADLPGLKPEDIQVNIEDDVLTIAGERKSESENTEGNVYRSERSYGRFERRIALPRGFDPNTVDAKFENGVLELSAPLPKSEPRGRKIEIKGRSDTKKH